MSPRFVPFGPDHIIVLLITAAAAAAILLNRSRLRGKLDRWARWGLAAVLLGNGLSSWGIGYSQGRIWLPLDLCDLALLLMAWGLLRPRERVCELAYFWGLGSFHPLLTPALVDPFPDFWWMTFFLGHGGIILGAVYLAGTDRLRPTGRSIWRVWLYTNLYAAGAGTVNWFAGTNFGFLARKPAQASLLDYLGPWPWYLLGMELVALASFLLYFSPFFIVSRFGRNQIRDAGSTGTGRGDPPAG